MEKGDSTNDSGKPEPVPSITILLIFHIRVGSRAFVANGFDLRSSAQISGKKGFWLGLRHAASPSNRNFQFAILKLLINKQIDVFAKNR